MITESEDTLTFEAAMVSETGESMFDPDASIEEELNRYRPPAGRGKQVATRLQELGFQIRHIGTFSVSGEGPADLWREVFDTDVEKRTQPISEAHPKAAEFSYWSHMADTPFTLPDELDGLVDRIYPQRPPTFFVSPLPPQAEYHHLRVPSDVATVLRSAPVQKQGLMGEGVLVAMPDSGFYEHPFYDWHGCNYNATLAPDAVNLEEDSIGHGTAEAANIFANAPNIDFVGVKMGRNPTLAFKTASDLHPAVMTNSWGFDVCGSTLPNYLKPLKAAVTEAVRDRGITVCFSAGNGQCGFPAQMPEVISVGGVYAHADLDGDDFRLEASDYASAFDSQIYPGRHVPDVCGLVGMKPSGVYIMLPVPPGSQIDTGLAGGTYPDNDETDPDDGWAVISGTSASSPQIAGVCALLKEVEPGLSPDLVKSILRASARDVTSGTSNETGASPDGQPAGKGHDGATGAGLVDAQVAYQLARSQTPRDLTTLPRPR